MRIAVVTTSYPEHAGDPSGHFVKSEVTQLAQQGHRMTVLTPGNAHTDHRAVAHVRVDGADLFGWPGALSRIREHPTRLLKATSFASSVASALERLGPWDRVIAHWIVPSAWPACRSFADRLEVVAHGSDVRLLSKLPRLLSERLVNRLIERGARFRVVSGQLLEQLSALCPAVVEVSRVEPAAIDVSRAPTRRKARRELSLGTETLLVVVARLVPEKRVRVALNAAQLLAPDYVVVVGDGPERRELEKAYPDVHFAGREPHPRALAWLAAADLMISASKEEGAPLAIREARALGVPVVSCPAGDLGGWALHDSDLWLTSA